MSVSIEDIGAGPGYGCDGSRTIGSIIQLIIKRPYSSSDSAAFLIDCDPFYLPALAAAVRLSVSRRHFASAFSRTGFCSNT
jgi:hypothetical protein